MSAHYNEMIRFTVAYDVPTLLAIALCVPGFSPIARLFIFLTTHLSATGWGLLLFRCNFAPALGLASFTFAFQYAVNTLFRNVESLLLTSFNSHAI